ncbi:shikimate kinase [Neisseria viridiae]|uniref:shikimate kinase n=1 Tax=Neisseria viridiae TaxID=2830648 RepID=UPI00265B2F30|nr:shikimate kinase [Neisseria viridiae]
MKNFTDKLILIGLMGAGKTTLGRQVARSLNYRFYDCDHEVSAAAGVSIPTIFEMEGEQGFRSRETAMLKKLVILPHIVLSTGGGAVLKEENRALIRKSGTVVYLHAPPETLLERTRCDSNRPLLQVADPLGRLRELYTARDPLYRQTADFTIESGNCRQTVQILLNLLSE